MPFLQFKGKTAVETYHHRLPHHLLEPVPERSVLPPDAAPTLEGNLIIEGDNLLALKSLLPTHAGRIKCVYIDPPYNTGNEGWVYNDNLTQPQFKEWIGQTVGKEGEDAARHDKWCCMMYPRLQLLNELLHDDGIVFVSIDDNEVHYLRSLMNEIFDEENFIVDFVWESRLNKDNRNVTGVSIAHEYIVCYGKKVRGGQRDASQYSNPDDDPRGPWSSANMVGLLPQELRPNCHYDITDPQTGIVYTKPNMGWRYDSTTMARLIDEKRILWPAEPSGRPRRKSFLNELGAKFTGFSSIVGSDVYTKDGTQEVEQIFGRRVFDYPKPSALIKELIEQGTEDDSIVLDSFAGSGTTAQAVLELNREDGGNRKFILVQQPYEPKKQDSGEQINITETITAERVRRVMQGYAYEGTQTETILEEKVGLNTLKKADELLKRIEAAKDAGKLAYDSVKAGMKDGVVTVEGIKKIEGKTDGIGGTFTYARVSENPLYGEYRNMENLPDYESLAAYIFYTETSRQFQPAELNRETGYIGSVNRVSYYLLYSPLPDDGIGIDAEFLKKVAAHDPNKKLVVYSEKFLMHRETLQKWEMENGKSLRSMLVPFELR